MNDRDLLTTEPYEKYLTERAELEQRYFSDKFADIPKLRYFYLASPYMKYPYGLDQAAEDAAKMSALCFNNGIMVFCPIVHHHPLNKYLVDEIGSANYDFWMKVDYMFLDNAIGLIVTKMTNWENSKGIALEIEYTKKLGKPIYYTEFMEIPNVLT